MANVKAETVSALERGDQCRPPRQATLAKLERALGVKLKVVRDQATSVMLYAASDKAHLIEEARTKWPELSTGAAIMAALQAWSDHREALRKWNFDHPDANLEV